jgi:hypothetical protein
MPSGSATFYRWVDVDLLAAETLRLARSSRKSRRHFLGQRVADKVVGAGFKNYNDFWFMEVHDSPVDEFNSQRFAGTGAALHQDQVSSRNTAEQYPVKPISTRSDYRFVAHAIPLSSRSGQMQSSACRPVLPGGSLPYEFDESQSTLALVRNPDEFVQRDLPTIPRDGVCDSI